MMQAGLRVTAVAGPTAFIPLAARADDERGTSFEMGAHYTAPAESDTDHRSAWANPFSKPPEPGVENDPTPFGTSGAGSNPETFAIDNLDQ